MAKKSSKKEIVKKIALFGGQLLRNVASNMSYSQGGGSLQFWDNGMPPWEMSQPKPKRKTRSSSSSSSSSTSRSRSKSTSKKSAPRDDIINGYVLEIAPDGTVGSAYKNGRYYIPYALFRYTDGEFWEPCIAEYTPDEIRVFIRQKAFRWVDEEKHRGRRR